VKRGILVGVLVAVAALVATVVVLSQRTDDVATVDGHSVTRDELLFHMGRLAPTVQNELRNAHDLRGAIDWNTRIGDTTALRRLASRALDEIRRDKTLLVLAKEQGLVESVDHADFLDELADENAARADAVAAGKTVYGVTEFSPEEYYTHRLAEITTSLKDRLGDGSLRVTDAEVRHEFDTNRADWSANATTYTYSRLVVPVPAGAAPDYAHRLQQRVSAAGRLAAVAAGEPGARLTEGTYGGSGSAGRNAHDQQLTAVLRNLAPGEVSTPVTSADHITYYQLDGKTVDEAEAFADYSQRIRISLVDEKFSQLLQRRVDDSAIEVDTAALDAITEEDVRL